MAKTGPPHPTLSDPVGLSTQSAGNCPVTRSSEQVWCCGVKGRAQKEAIWAGTPLTSFLPSTRLPGRLLPPPRPSSAPALPSGLWCPGPSGLPSPPPLASLFGESRTPQTEQMDGDPGLGRGRGRASRCREEKAVWGKQNRGRSQGEGGPWREEAGIRREGPEPGAQWGRAPGWGGGPPGSRLGLV